MKELRIDDDLTLAVLRENEIDNLNELVRANLDHIAPWEVWAVDDYGIEQAAAFVHRNLERDHPGKQSFGIFYNGALCGCAGFVPREEKGVAEIGYWVSREHQGKGIITRCARALTDHAFRDQGVNRVEIRTAALNLRSRAIAERLRFELIDRKKDQRTLPNGIIDDLVVYSMHKKNWK